MNSRTRCIYAAVLAAALLPSGCESRQPADRATTEPPLPEPAVPAGYQKIAPAPVDSSAQMLRQTAVVFRATLRSVQFTYNDCSGPRTNYVFSDSRSLVGAQVDAQITVSVLGGPTPNGTWIRVREIPQLALDSQYVTFLRNTDWTLSPIIGNLVFRLEMIAGREVSVSPTGHAVTGWGENGPLLSDAPVSEAVGRQLLRYRLSDPSTQAGHSSSAETNPGADVAPATGDPPAPATGRTQNTTIARAPTLAEARRVGLFARPAVSGQAIADERTVSVESFVTEVRDSADRARINIGGRTALTPYWRCWGYIPTVRARR
jgi:hypothetical protein